MFAIVESVTTSKTGCLADNEDRLIVDCKNFVAVIDGATPKLDLLKKDGLSSAQISGKLIEGVIRALPAEATAQEAFDSMTQAIYQYYERAGVVSQMVSQPAARATSSVLVLSKYRQELWSVGDCAALADGEMLFGEKRLDRVTSEARAMALEAYIAAGETVESLLVDDKGRSAILPLLKVQAMHQNQPGPFGYGVVDGFDCSNCIETKSVAGASSIVLASDGYPEPLTTLEESEARLAEVLALDPLCFRLFKSTKGLKFGNLSFDDRSYIRLEKNK